MSEIPTRKRVVPEVTVSDTTAEDRLYAFIEKQIDRMKKYTNLGEGGPTFFELNEALSNWSNVNCSLITLDVMAKQDYQKAKNAYDEFIADKYFIIRNENNLPSLSAQKWLSTQEIMYLVQRDPRWCEEYRNLRDELNITEKKVAFCRRLLDNMESFKYTLGTLSKNVQAEVLNLTSATHIGLEQN